MKRVARTVVGATLFYGASGTIQAQQAVIHADSMQHGAVHAPPAPGGTRLCQLICADARRIDNRRALLQELPDFATTKGAGLIRGFTVAAGTALFVHDSTGLIEAFDASTGAFRWRRAATGSVHCDPYIDDGRVIVGVGVPAARQPHPAGVEAFDLKSGDSLWFRLLSHVMPCLWRNGDTVYALSGDSALYGLNAASGSVYWKLALPGVPYMSTIRGDGAGAAWFGVQGRNKEGQVKSRVVHFDPRTRRIKSTLDLPFPGAGDITVATACGLVFTAAWEEVPPAAMLGILARQPALAWHKVLMKFGAERWRSISRHWVFAFDAISGRERWRYLIGAGLTVARNTSGRPVSDGCSVIVASRTAGTVVEVSRSGLLQWRFRSPDLAIGGAVPGPGLCWVVATARGSLTLLREGRARTVPPSAPVRVFTPAVLRASVLYPIDDGTLARHSWSVEERAFCG